MLQAESILPVTRSGSSDCRCFLSVTTAIHKLPH